MCQIIYVVTVDSMDICQITVVSRPTLQVLIQN
jgi:hypothetical protein